ncbi:MAG: GAF domain-containing protein [Chloroflexi bacterium]|nr:GAF domain-containing protein [Chloroflexota bacterium]
MSLRQRLLLLVLSITALIMILITVLALDSATRGFATQTNRALIARSQSAAYALDGYIASVSATTQALAAVLNGRDHPPIHAIWHPASQVLTDPETPIARIVVARPFRDDRQIVSFRRPDASVRVAPLANVITPARPAPVNRLATATTDTVMWFGPQPGYRARAQQAVMAAAIRFVGADQQPTGLVWAEVPVESLTTVVEAAVNLDPIWRTATLLILDADDNVITTAGTTRTASQDITAAVTAAQLDETVIVAANPFDLGSPAYATRSAIPGTGWQLVSLIPTRIIEEPLTQSNMEIVLLMIAGLCVLGWVVSGFANRTLTAPLGVLTQAAQEIGAGAMRFQISHIDRQDEIGELARALEDMKRSQSDTYERLAQARRTLEYRVTVRTAELHKAQRQAQDHAADLLAVYEISLSLVNEYFLQTILQRLTEHVPSLLDAPYCAIWLRMQDEEWLKLVATTTLASTHLGREISVNDGIAGAAIRAAKPIVVDDYTDWTNRLDWTPLKLKRALCVPLLHSGKAIGAIVAGREEHAPVFNDNDRRLLALLANLASPVVRNAQLFDQLDDAVQRAEQANQVKTRFLASVTHELRTPLNLIINNLDFMRIGLFGPVTDDQRTRLDQAIRSSENLLYLINDLLDVSKIEAGEMQLFIQPTELQPIVVDALDSGIALMTDDHAVAIQLDLPEEPLPQIPVDARRLRQVLINLLSNAIKFTKQGEIWLQVRVRDDVVEFIVTDTGIGIPEEDLETIFRAFERSKRAKQLGIEGTGLGLAISRHLVEAHGGKIRVETTVGAGSRFSFVIPRRIHAARDETATMVPVAPPANTSAD